MNKETVCAVVRDLLPSYLDHLTEEATGAFVEQHLTECAQCRAVRRNMLNIAVPGERAQAEFMGRLRRARKRRVRRAWAIAISVIVVLTACLVPLPKSVNMEVQALRWRAGHPEQGSEAVQVVIRGTYMDYLFRDDTFDGDIMIGDEQITQREDALARVIFDPTGYLVYADEERLLKTVGFIVTRPGFEGFVIGLHDRTATGGGSWSGDDGTVLTWPAQSRESAVETTERILTEQGCTWLTESVWEAGQSSEEWEAQGDV